MNKKNFKKFILKTTPFVISLFMTMSYLPANNTFSVVYATEPTPQIIDDETARNSEGLTTVLNEAINEASEREQLIFDLKTTGQLPGSLLLEKAVLTTLKNKHTGSVTATFNVFNNDLLHCSWTFVGSNILEELKTDPDLIISTLDTASASVNTLFKDNDAKTCVVSFDSVLPANLAQVKVRTAAFKNVTTPVHVYSSATAKSQTKKDSMATLDSGYASFNISDCSTHVLSTVNIPVLNTFSIDEKTPETLATTLTDYINGAAVSSHLVFNLTTTNALPASLIINTSVFEALKTKDSTVTFNVRNEIGNLVYSWTFNGSEVIEDLEGYVGFNLIISTPDTANATINAIFKDNDAKTCVVSFGENTLPTSSAQVKVSTAAFAGVTPVYVYSNVTTESQTEAGTATLDSGYVSFNISDCSTHVLSTVNTALSVNTEPISLDKRTDNEICDDLVTQLKTVEDNKAVVFNFTTTADALRSNLKISKIVLQKLKEKQAIVTFNIFDKNEQIVYSWTFDGNDLTDEALAQFDNVDLALNIEQQSSVVDAIVTEAQKSCVVKFKHSGNLPATVKVTVKTGEKFLNTDEVFLYFYDSTNLTIQKVENAAVEIKDGYASFNVSHCSEYILTTANLSNVFKNSSNSDNDTTTKSDTNTDATTNTTTSDTSNTSDKPGVYETSDNTKLVYGLCSLVVSAVMSAVVFFKRKKFLK